MIAKWRNLKWWKGLTEAQRTTVGISCSKQDRLESAVCKHIAKKLGCGWLDIFQFRGLGEEVRSEWRDQTESFLQANRVKTRPKAEPIIIVIDD